jgi:uncharacterized protein
MNKKNLNQTIADITDQLVNKYKAQKVILFGSTVNKKTTDNSDLDFLIIKADTPNSGIDRIREVEKLVKTSFPCDFIIARPEELKQRLSMNDPFLSTILEEGITLYDG